MKQLIFALCAMLCLGACKQDLSPPKQTASLAPYKLTKDDSTGITLTGIPFADAGTMINALSDDNTAKEPITNIWLSERWLNKMSTLLESEGADGFRIYFAKKKDGSNAAIVVSTKPGEANTTAPSKANHYDYFIHKSNFLTSISTADYQEDHIGAQGATLYNNAPPCSTDGCIINKANHRITCDQAYGFVTAFKNQKPINTIGEWFPSELLQLLEDELSAAKASINADGIRIYFAKKQKKNAFIIVTTYKIKDGVHADYYKCYSNNNKDINDHGEECPLNCSGFTWPEPDPGP